MKDHRYLQIERALRQKISDGICPVGSRLPTEQELAQEFSVSRYTVREALRRLRDDRLVSSRRHRGTLVLRQPKSNQHDVMTINDLRTFAASTRLTVESIDMVTIDDELRDKTGLSRGENWTTVRGFRRAQGAEDPLCWMEYYVNSSFAGVCGLLQGHTGAVFTLIEDRYRVTITETREEITAILTPPDLADALKVPEGTPVLRARRTYVTSEGEVAQVTVNTYAPSRFRHSITIRRKRR